MRAQWYSLKQISQRGYILLPEERLVPVNALVVVRLLGLEFTNSYSAGRKLRSAKKSGGPLHFLSEDTHNVLLAACRQCASGACPLR